MVILYSILALFGLLLIIQAFILRYFIKSFRYEPEYNENMPQRFNVPFETWTIPTANQKVISAWLLHHHHKNPSEVVIVSHGWTRSATFLWPISYGLWAAGYTVMAINARNHAESDPDPPIHVGKYAEDILATIKAVNYSFPHAAVSLVGHSLGGAASIIAASKEKSVQKLATMCAFSDTLDLMKHDLKMHQIPYFWFGWLALKFVRMKLGVPFDDLSPMKAIESISIPTCLIHSEFDERIPLGMMSRLSAASRNKNIQTIVISGASHTGLLTMEETLNVILAFLKKE